MYPKKFRAAGTLDPTGQLVMYNKIPHIIPVLYIVLIIVQQGSSPIDAHIDQELLDEIVHRDPLSEISEQEKELIWRMR